MFELRRYSMWAPVLQNIMLSIIPFWEIARVHSWNTRGWYRRPLLHEKLQLCPQYSLGDHSWLDSCLAGPDHRRLIDGYGCWYSFWLAMLQADVSVSLPLWNWFLRGWNRSRCDRYNHKLQRHGTLKYLGGSEKILIYGDFNRMHVLIVEIQKCEATRTGRVVAVVTRIHPSQKNGTTRSYLKRKTIC